MAAARPLILALDQGTTSSRAIVFDAAGEVVAAAQAEFPQLFPAPGWVEHDPEAIWATQLRTARRAMRKAEASGGRVVAVGITNQRETTVVWDRETGQPLYNAIVWQDRRTADACRKLASDGAGDEVRAKTGLLLDPYFSAAKVAWILDRVEGARSRAAGGGLAFGTIDSFLIWRLTGGRAHLTDATNASRTSLFDIRGQDWDGDLCRLFRVPPALLPPVEDCAADFGLTEPGLFDRSLPILAVAGDQQAALVGQGALKVGEVKATYGTGAFLLVNTGARPTPSNNRLLTTVGYRLAGKPTYALEGSIFVAGAAVQWLRDGLKIVRRAADTEGLAKGLHDAGGVYVVPAFTGLGAPHWDPDARGAIFGLTRATGPAQIARATLEAVALQTHDLLAAVRQDGVAPAALKVDGGMAANAWFCQALADICDLPVERPKVLETTALGTARLAAMQAGLVDGLDGTGEVGARFEPAMPDGARRALLEGWAEAVRRTLSRPG